MKKKRRVKLSFCLELMYNLNQANAWDGVDAKFVVDFHDLGVVLIEDEVDVFHLYHTIINLKVKHLNLEYDTNENYE